MIRTSSVTIRVDDDDRTIRYEVECQSDPYRENSGIFERLTHACAEGVYAELLNMEDERGWE